MSNAFFRWATARDQLAEQGITLIFDNHTITPDDAWTAARAKHGDRIAVANEYGGHWYGDAIRVHENGRDHDLHRLYLAHPHWDLTVGEAVADALEVAGLTVEWDRTAGSSILVHLGN